MYVDELITRLRQCGYSLHIGQLFVVMVYTLVSCLSVVQFMLMTLHYFLLHVFLLQQSTRNVRHYFFSVDELSIYGIICRPLLTLPPWLNSSVVCYKLTCQSTYCIVLVSKVVFQDGCKCSIEPVYPCLSCFFATYCYVPDVILSCMSVLNFH